VVPIGTVIARISTSNGVETAKHLKNQVQHLPQATRNCGKNLNLRPKQQTTTAAPEFETPTLIAEAYYATEEIPYTPAQEETPQPEEPAANFLRSRSSTVSIHHWY
jgi:pyruvate/2-oxoglutarate dehydrogenase complex dihydrolipoamide acyltransferase (E2) component